ncbi:TonB-dependent receptor [Sphingomonas canadensis]|uniref:TonB-dependent receptor n=1 Tax=Sphingomonas canadensis TaxID=1219257 RepID=A0ABW3H8Q0_9SPHN|nr:TonB-dependent receptor [Sphingomonas canadensis]MCW3836946.1 TonB-dependent receptor [Sphingomonas canadensis]
MSTHRNFRTARVGILAAASILGIATSTGAAAQEAETADKDEIVVTATHREEKVQDIPISISVETGEALEKLGADSLQDFAGKVPGLEFASFGPGLNRVTIRGISTQTGESSTGFYIDEMPVTADPTAQPDVKMFDIDRVEILRGPQGTLFGESSLGGTVRIITRQPDATAFAAAAQGTVSKIKGGGWNYSLDGMVNIPIVSDTLALRVVGSYRHDAGYIDNVLLGQKNVNDGHSLNYRAALAWTPDAALEVVLTYQGSNQENDGEFISNRARQQFRYLPEGRDDDFDRYNLTVKYDGGFANLISSTSYFDRATTHSIDQTGAATGLLPPGVTALQVNASDYKIFVQEVRLVSAKPGPVDWVVGGFYKNSKRTFVSSVVTNPYLGALLDGDNDYKFRQWALFGEGTWHVTDRLHATIGLRYFEENDRFRFISSGALTGPGLSNSSVEKSSEFAPRFSLKYDVTDSAMFYATASRGFRAGGANPSKPIFDLLGVPLATTYAPDTLWNYEAGFKSELFDRRLTFNLAAYHMDWKDIQLPANAAVFTGTFNGGNATSDGVELELVARPATGLTLNLSGNYTDAKLSDTVIITTPGGPVVAALKGNELPLVPKWKAGLGGEYSLPIGGEWNAAFRANWSFVGKRYNFADNNPAERLDSYEVLDLQLAFEGPKYDIVLFADNVTDEFAAYATLSDPSLPGMGIYTANRPATYGVTVRAKF